MLQTCALVHTNFGENVEKQFKHQKPTDELGALAYGAAMVARMYPNYALFAELTESSDQQVFANILNLVWEYIGGKNQRIDFHKQQDKLEAITPDPEAFDFYGVWPAMDATVALGSLLAACELWDADEIDAIELVSLSTIGHYLDVMEEVGDDSPLYDAEEDYQQALWKAIEHHKNSRTQLVAAVRNVVKERVVSNIGLEAG